VWKASSLLRGVTGELDFPRAMKSPYAALHILIFCRVPCVCEVESLFCQCPVGLSHRMAWEKDHNAHPVPTPCYVQGRQLPDQAAQSHIQPGLECLQGWSLQGFPLTLSCAKGKCRQGTGEQADLLRAITRMLCFP